MLVPQENDLAVGRAPIPEEVCSPPRAHVPKYPSRPRTCARARPDFRVFAVLLPIRLTSDAFHRWQAEAKNPLTPLQRAREAKKAKKEKRGEGPWGGAALAAVQKKAARREAASLMLLLPAELLALVHALANPLGELRESSLSAVCRVIRNLVPLTLADGRVRCIALPLLLEAWPEGRFALAGVGRGWLARVNAHSERRREVVKARKKAREDEWMDAHVQVWWDGDGVFHRGLVLRVNDQGTRVRVRFDEPVGRGPSTLHWVLPDELSRVP